MQPIGEHGSLHQNNITDLGSPKSIGVILIPDNEAKTSACTQPLQL